MSQAPWLRRRAWPLAAAGLVAALTACGGAENPLCAPTTCATAGLNCGSASDGCGGSLACGTCPTPQTCGGGATANVCGTGACTPKTCADQGIQCGSAGDGCGGSLACGFCLPGKTCGGVPAVCGP